MTLVQDFHSRIVFTTASSVGIYALATDRWPSPRWIAVYALLAFVYAAVAVELRYRREERGEA